jgi:hypothetical protein
MELDCNEGLGHGTFAFFAASKLAMPRLSTAIALAAVLAACGSGTSSPTSTTAAGEQAATTATTATTTTTVPEATTTTVAESPTTTTLTSTTSTTGVQQAGRLPLERVDSLPTLTDGRPATFLAITSDFAAVEVATDTGEVVREIGQFDDAETLQNAEVPAAVGVIDFVWRTVDGSRVGVSVCCEPAAGAIFFVGPGQTLDDVENATTGWAGAGSPIDGTSAVVGYDLVVSSPSQQVYSEELLEGFIAGTPTYSRDGAAVYWIADTGSTFLLQAFDFSAEEPDRIAHRLEWVGDDQSLTGLGTNADGNFVAFTTDDAFEETEAVVIDAGGDLVGTFDVPDGAVFGGYDRSGLHLIYVDEAGAARWLGPDGAGELGSGYLYASW